MGAGPQARASTDSAWSWWRCEGEEEIEEIDDGPTETEEKKNQTSKSLTPPPPPVRGINQENAPLANLPVSMALPIIDPKQVVRDLIAGKPPAKPPPPSRPSCYE